MNKEKSIRVTGKGTVSLKPDVTLLNLSLEGKDPDYGTALEHSAERTRELRSIVSDLGFKKEDFKTASFNVDVEYEGYQDSDGSYKQRFAGYRYSHSLSLEFPVDNKLLGQLLFAFAASSASPLIHISYTVRDKESAKEDLLRRCIEDAISKAVLLTESARVELKEIVSIDYSSTEPDFIVRPMSRKIALTENAMMDRASGSIDIDIEPGNVIISDTVTITWTIQ